MILNEKYRIKKKGTNISEETKQIMSDTAKKIDHPGRFKKGDNHPGYGQTRSEDTKTKISDTLIGHKGAAQPTSQGIEVLDKDNNKTTTYDSMREAARALNLPNFNIIKN